MEAEVRAFGYEGVEGVRLDVLLPCPLLGLLHFLVCELLVSADQFLEGVGRFEPLPGTSPEPHTLFKGDSLFALAAWALIFLESGVFARFELGIEECSQF